MEIKQLIESHRAHNRIGELRKMQEELQQVIDNAHERVEAALDKWYTAISDKEKLESAQKAFADIEEAIRLLK